MHGTDDDDSETSGSADRAMDVTPVREAGLVPQTKGASPAASTSPADARKWTCVICQDSHYTVNKKPEHFMYV